MSALTTLAGTEIRLLTREWAAMVFAFAFPPLFMLVLAGVFGTEDDMGGTGVSGTDYYIAGYIGVPMGALALVGLPVMLASYRERDVLRRFDAFGVPTSRVVAAQALVTGALIVLAAGLVVATAAPLYGVPAIEDPANVAVGFVAGTITMIALGVALGLAVPTARAAQALGMLVFMPMWLLGGGGPPRDVMSGAMADISDVLPLWHVTSGIREPWLNGTGVTDHLLAMAPWLIVGLVATAILLRRRGARV
jgi:ABC-2 type transport system permease protein